MVLLWCAHAPSPANGKYTSSNHHVYAPHTSTMFFSIDSTPICIKEMSQAQIQRRHLETGSDLNDRAPRIGRSRRSIILVLGLTSPLLEIAAKVLLSRQILKHSEMSLANIVIGYVIS